MNPGPVVTLYGREGCTLCAEARQLLDALAPVLGFRVEEVDIAANPVLDYRYRWAIPVIAIGEQELARAPIRAAKLEDALREALAPHP
jgi:glutaredoxin